MRETRSPGSVFLIFFVFLSVDHNVGQDAEDEGAGDLGHGNGAEADCKSADTGDEDNGYHEEVAVVAEVDSLYHLKTRHCDEAVERDAHAAHDAGRNGRKECGEGSYEGGKQAEHCGSDYRYDRGVAGDSHATDRFAVGGVGATAEDGACHGAYAVTEKGVGKSGVFEQVVLDDGGEVLVVCDVLGKDHEGNGNVCYCYRAYVSGVNVRKAAERLDKGEFGNPLHVCEEGEVDYLECVDTGDISDYGEDGSDCITGYDADDEGDHFEELLAVYRAGDGHTEGDESANDGDIGGGYRCSVYLDRSGGEIADGVSGKRKTDDGNGGTDNDGGHDLIYPCNAAELDDDRDHDIYKTGERRADDETGISGCCRDGTRKGGAH